jgi:hypothetical protein
VFWLDALEWLLAVEALWAQKTRLLVPDTLLEATVASVLSGTSELSAEVTSVCNCDADGLVGVLSVADTPCT